jgi:hypothetical protein
VLARLRQTSAENGVNLIIFYHPHLTLNSDGSASADTNAEYLALFKNACDNNGVYFVDMTETFTRAYRERHVLPHGFWNTHVGAGHLNKNGHSLIARELFEQIQALEKDGV